MLTAALTVNAGEPIKMNVRLLGPSDVVGISPHDIVRREPPPDTTAFESNHFAGIEFDRPDFPWLFTPAKATDNARLRPWLCLVVVRRQEGVTLRPGVSRPLPSIEIASAIAPDELPDLDESWLWAHGQAAGGSSTDVDALRSTLTGDPSASLSRLLCPRHLAHNTEYIAALQEKNEADLSQSERQELNKITNSLMKRVGPKVADEIRRGVAGAPPKKSVASYLRSAFAYVSSPPVIQGSIFAICTALIIVIIPLTTSFNRLTVSIAELREVEQDDFFFIVYQARTANKHGGLLGQDVQKSLKKLRDITSKINANNLTINSTIELSTGAPKWFAVMLAAYGFSGPQGVRLAAAPAVAAAATPGPGITAPAPQQCPKDDEICLNYLFTAAYGIDIRNDDVSSAYFNRRQAESAVALLGGSMLPVLYGLLGASVYLLRRYLGEANLEMDPNFGMRAYLRLGLGGIAGLAIGWFWTPSSMDVATLTTAPFALAFLGGFSIELLFSILDRIIAAVNPSTAERNADPARGPRGGRPTRLDPTQAEPSVRR
jgi:hypothetical protein